MSKEVSYVLFSVITIIAIIGLIASSWFLADLIRKWNVPTPIEITNPKITVLGEYIEIETTQELNIELEQGKPYSIIIKTEDIEKVIEENEKSKIKPD